MGQYKIVNIKFESNLIVSPDEKEGIESIPAMLIDLNVYFNRESWIVGETRKEFNDLQAVYKRIIYLTRKIYREYFREKRLTVDNLNFDLICLWEEFTLRFRLDENSNLVIS